MTKFVPISELDENLALLPQFYVEIGAAPLDAGADGGPVPLLPPLNQEEVIANGTLLALFDAGIASRPKGASFVVVQSLDTTPSGNADAAGATLKYFLWNGRTFETRQIQIAKSNLDRLRSLIEEEGILSKAAATAGITGATPNIFSILSAIENLPSDLWPLFSLLSSYGHAFESEANSALSKVVQDALDDWLEAAGGLDGIALKPLSGTEELREIITFEVKSTERAWQSWAEGEQRSDSERPNSAPNVGLIKLPVNGSAVYVAFLAPILSRDLIVQFMDALALRLKEQQDFLERCWQIIGTEISSRVRHMFKNRIGSAYDEINSIKKTATEKGWIAAITQPPEVVEVQRAVHGDSDDYYQIGAHLGRIEENLKAVERAVEQLSKFYRGARGVRELVSVNAVLEQQLTNWRAVRPDVEIFKELDPVAPLCLIVPETLAEVFDNIFGNSQKFIPRNPGHHIFVTTSLVRDKVIIGIANDGPSDLPDNPTKLFVTTDPKGSGVGLHLVERLVCEAGGHFSIAPRQTGAGVVNHIELPNPKWEKTEA